MTIEVVISPAAEREIKKLSREGRKAVFKILDVLQATTRPRGVEMIQGHPGFFRIRSGDFRVIYHPLTAERIVILVAGDRKNSYKAVGDIETRLKTAIVAASKGVAAQP